jgi:hypothetical protein
MIRDTAHAREVGAEVTADGCQVSVHARSHFAVQPWFAIFGAKDDVSDDFTERLGQGANNDRTGAESESRFQRWRFEIPRTLGRCPRLPLNTAPMALNKYERGSLQIAHPMRLLGRS